MHAQGDFSLHATLPLPLAAVAERAGWAEPHFVVRTGQAPATVLMLYGPRDDLERDVVLRLVRAVLRVRLSPDSQASGNTRPIRWKTTNYAKEQSALHLSLSKLLSTAKSQAAGRSSAASSRTAPIPSTAWA